MLARAWYTSTHQPEGQRTWMMASTSCTRAPRLMPPMPLPARKGASAAGKSRQQQADSMQHKHGQRRQGARRVDRHGRPGSRTGLKDSLPPACGGIPARVASSLGSGAAPHNLCTPQQTRKRQVSRGAARRPRRTRTRARLRSATRVLAAPGHLRFVSHVPFQTLPLPLPQCVQERDCDWF